MHRRGAAEEQLPRRAVKSRPLLPPPSSSSGCIFLELYLDGVMMLFSPTTTTTTITPPEVGYCASPTTTTVRAPVPYVRAVEQSMHTADGAQRRTMCAAVRGVRVQSVSE